MKGRTRSFFEDTFVLLIVAAILIAVYYFFFNGENQKEQTPPITTIEKEQTQIEKEDIVTGKIKEEILEDNSTIETEDNNSTVVSSKELNITKQTSPDTVIEITEKEEETQNKQIVPKKVDPNRIAHLVKNVDLKLLKQFKADVKQSMQNNIVLDETKDKANQSFSIRVTVLKNGSYEQLIFTGGDRDTFEKNQEKLLKVFPLEIDPKIEQDFPRYLRYSFKFSKIDN